MYQSLKENYGIENPKECKIEMVFEGRDGTEPSEWWVRQSDYAKKMERVNRIKYPEDKATLEFRVTTPKNEDGIAYVLPLEVKYSLFKDGDLTNKWYYYYWKFKAPNKIIGKIQEKEFHAMMMEKVKNFKPEFQPGYDPECPKFLRGYYKVNSITSSEIPDKMSKASNRESITRYYNVDGDYQYLPGLDYDTVKDNRIGRKVAFGVTFTRNLKFGNQEESPWKLYEFLGHSPKFLDDGEAVADYEVMPTIERFGFEYVYQKDNEPIGKAYFSEGYRDNWISQVKSALLKMYNGDSQGLEELKKFTTSEEIAMSFQKVMDEAKAKMVEIHHNKYDYGADGMNITTSEFEEGGSVKIMFGLYRPRCEKGDKACINKYKEAGMSKSVIKEKQYVSTTESQYVDIILKDNQFYINEGIQFKKPPAF